MFVAELIALLVIALGGGILLALWAADRDDDIDAWSGADIAWAVVVTAAAGGIALGAVVVTFPFGAFLAASAIVVVWAGLLGLATSRRHPTIRRVLALPIGVVVVLRGLADPA